MYRITNPVGDANAKSRYTIRNQYADVLIVQRLLCITANSLNKPEYHPGDADGRIGANTCQAIRAFQRSFWNSPDGLVEPYEGKANTFSRLVDNASRIPAVLDRTKMDTLNADFHVKASMVIDRMRDLGWHLRIIWGRRTKAENDALVQKGTASKTSKHLDGLAVDVIDTRVGYSSNRNHRYYSDLQRICQEVGVLWGGTFTKRWDPTHFEEKGIQVGPASQVPGISAMC
jgi:hypothetical protein